MAVDSKKMKAAKIIQAYCRGFLLRKQIKLVRKEFEEIVTEIEGDNNNMKINWPQGKLYSRPLFVPKGQEQYPTSSKNFSEMSNIQSSSHTNFDSQLSREESNRMNSKVKCKNCGDSVSQSSAESLPEAVVTSDCRTADTIAVSVSQEVNLQLSKHKSNNISKVEAKNCGKLTENFAESLPELEIASDGETSIDTVKVCRVNHKPVQTNSDMEKKQSINENESQVEELIEISPALSHADEVYLSSTPMPSTENAKTRSWIPDGPRLFLKNSDFREDQEMSYRGIPVLTESWMTDHSFEPVSDECKTKTLRQLTRAELQERKEKLSMEVLWIQQAIGSRKNYLRIKKSIRQSSLS